MTEPQCWGQERKEKEEGCKLQTLQMQRCQTH